MDSLSHWFSGDYVTLRPDLLQLTLEVRPDDIPLVRAVVLECKLAQQNPVHLAKAKEQVQEGLRHLTGLLAPKHGDLRRLGFDRRYWWENDLAVLGVSPAALVLDETSFTSSIGSKSAAVRLGQPVAQCGLALQPNAE